MGLSLRRIRHGCLTPRRDGGDPGYGGTPSATADHPFGSFAVADVSQPCEPPALSSAAASASWTSFSACDCSLAHRAGSPALRASCASAYFASAWRSRLSTSLGSSTLPPL